LIPEWDQQHRPTARGYSEKKMEGIIKAYGGFELPAVWIVVDPSGIGFYAGDPGLSFGNPGLAFDPLPRILAQRSCAG
jgi:hypothetical protein